ncbi:MAG: DUF6798 domain-containing protein [Bryobacteraceae bacterium]|nr:DUF6798 domain-containing protein [Bryobacteraceae bacterium]
MREQGGAALALAALTLLGFFTIPGHTYLQSDTQIYMPLLERLRDPSVFENELLIRGQHVSFTAYDEITLGLNKITGLDFPKVLALQQLVFRFCALAGVYLFVTALGLGSAAAVLVASCFGLGAWITGPSIITFEYEPVPRANAVGLTMLAIGLTAHAWYFRAGCAAALSFLYQVPAVYPFWAGYALLAMLPGRRKMVRGLVAMAMGVALLLVLAKLQTGQSEKQEFFTRIDDAQEKVMRERASYNWVSMWQPRYYVHHAIMLAAALLALWRLRAKLAVDLRILVSALLAIGVASVPVSWVLLEGLKWNLIPQIQPARALLYVTAFAGILGAAAGIVAAREKRWWEAFAWFVVVYSLPSRSGPVQALLDWTNPTTRRIAMVVIGLGVAASLLVSLRGRAGGAALMAAAVMPYLAIPNLAGIRNYPDLHTPEIYDLAAWAKRETPKDAVFLFPDAAKSLHPGIFRANALRAVYVDWKGGGQVNYLRKYMDAWLPRWQQAMAIGFDPKRASREEYARLGIDFLAVEAKNRIAGWPVAYGNGKYLVYRLGD